MNKTTVILSNCLKPMTEIFKKKPVEKNVFSTEEQRITADFS